MLFKKTARELQTKVELCSQVSKALESFNKTLDRLEKAQGDRKR